MLYVYDAVLFCRNKKEILLVATARMNLKALGCDESDEERQVLHGLAQLWNLKKLNSETVEGWSAGAGGWGNKELVAKHFQV